MAPIPPPVPPPDEKFAPQPPPGPPLVPKGFPGPYAYVTVPYSLMQEAFKKAKTDPRAFWRINPSDKAKEQMIAHSAQADQTDLVTNDRVYRVLTQYLGNFDTDKKGIFVRISWPTTHLYFSPIDPTKTIAVLRPWTPSF